jgi:hypothetical protein
VSVTFDLLADGYGRVQELVHGVLNGLSEEDLVFRPGPDANPIGWLVWHLSRVQDAQIADAAGFEQRWTAEGWVDRFALPFDRLANGYGQDPAETGMVQVDANLLEDYHDAVHEASIEYFRHVSDEDLRRVVDTRWDPPVTLGVRLVSILADDLQHVGQAAYIRGLLRG